MDEISPGLGNAGLPLEGVATAGQPEEGHLRKLAEAGYRTVIDLRAPEEHRGFDEAEAVRRAGMEYVNIPVKDETVGDEAFDGLREILAEAERRPALVHCASANRVGAILIPYLVLDEGMSLEEAGETASKVGLRGEGLKRRAIAYLGERHPPL